MDIEMSRYDWEKLHKEHETDVISMIMDYKHHRITQTDLVDLIESYVERSYEMGVFRGRDLFG